MEGWFAFWMLAAFLIGFVLSLIFCATAVKDDDKELREWRTGKRRFGETAPE